MEQQLATPVAEKLATSVHIGSLICRELHRRHLPVVWLAEVLQFDRSNVYKILRKRSIDTHLLCRISVALNHDFFEELQQACGFRPCIPSENH